MTGICGCYIHSDSTHRGGGTRWQRSRRPKFRLVPGIQLDRDQTILNTYELNRRSKKRIAATLWTEKQPLSGRLQNGGLEIILLVATGPEARQRNSANVPQKATPRRGRLG
ncbi:uncharacterized protein LOC144379232 isoform X1 [Halichoerus grypus]